MKSSEPKIRITERDFSVCKFLATHRAACPLAIKDRFYPETRFDTMTKRLAKLARHGIVCRNNDPPFYFLGRRGAKLLESQGILPPRKQYLHASGFKPKAVRRYLSLSRFAAKKGQSVLLQHEANRIASWLEYPSKRNATYIQQNERVFDVNICAEAKPKTIVKACQRNLDKRVEQGKPFLGPFAKLHFGYCLVVPTPVKKKQVLRAARAFPRVSCFQIPFASKDYLRVEVMPELLDYYQGVHGG